MKLQPPLAATAAVPTRSAPLYTRTQTAPAGATPLRVGVGSSVVSPCNIDPITGPKSSVSVRPDGAPGAVVSTVNANAVLGALRLPAGSVCVTLRLCGPSLKALVVTLQAPLLPTTALPTRVVPSNTSIKAPGSPPLPLKVGRVSSVNAPLFSAPVNRPISSLTVNVGTPGACVSMETL